MNSPQTIADIIKKIASEKKISINALLSECNLNKNALFTMQSGNMPRLDSLCLIADKLNVSIDYLLGRDAPAGNVDAIIVPKTERQLTAQEQDMLRIFNNSDGKTQLRIMQFIYDTEEKGNK